MAEAESEKINSRKKHYFDNYNYEPEVYEDYECLICGITESEEPDDGHCGIIFPTNPETYLCGNCNWRIEFAKKPFKQSKLL
jgi:hypothetical protein